jgi:hypothetical protein
VTDQPTTGADAGAEAVAAAIGRLGQATPADIATAAGIAYSTTNKKLRALRDAGRAESFDSPDKRTLWQLTIASTAATAEQPDGGPAAAAAEQPPAATTAAITGRTADDTTASPSPLRKPATRFPHRAAPTRTPPPPTPIRRICRQRRATPTAPTRPTAPNPPAMPPACPHRQTPTWGPATPPTRRLPTRRVRARPGAPAAPSTARSWTFSKPTRTASTRSANSAS